MGYLNCSVDRPADHDPRPESTVSGGLPGGDAVPPTVYTGHCRHGRPRSPSRAVRIRVKWFYF